MKSIKRSKKETKGFGCETQKNPDNFWLEDTRTNGDDDLTIFKRQIGSRTVNAHFRPSQIEEMYDYWRTFMTKVYPDLPVSEMPETKLALLIEDYQTLLTDLKNLKSDEG